MNVTDYLRYFFALLAVLAMIGALPLAARYFGLVARNRKSNGQQRIEVVESRMLDGKRRLVLVRRDQMEHLLLLGASGETIVESNIVAANAGSAPDNLANFTLPPRREPH